MPGVSSRKAPPVQLLPGPELTSDWAQEAGGGSISQPKLAPKGGGSPKPGKGLPLPPPPLLSGSDPAGHPAARRHQKVPGKRAASPTPRQPGPRSETGHHKQSRGRKGGGDVSKAPLETRQNSRNRSDNPPAGRRSRRGTGGGRLTGAEGDKARLPPPPALLLEPPDGEAEGISAQDSPAGGQRRRRPPHLAGPNGGSQRFFPGKGHAPDSPHSQASWEGGRLNPPPK